MQQAAQPTEQPLLTDEESEQMMELLLSRTQKHGHPRDSDGKPLLTQEMVSEAMQEVLQARYEKKFEKLEQQLIKPLQQAIEQRHHQSRHQQQLPNGTPVSLSIDAINFAVAKWTVLGWFSGLAYFNWFSSASEHLSLWSHAVLIIGGLFGSSILIGGGVSLTVAAATKILTGRPDGSAFSFMLAGCISPILAFFAAKYGLQMLS